MTTSIQELAELDCVVVSSLHKMSAKMIIHIIFSTSNSNSDLVDVFRGAGLRVKYLEFSTPLHTSLIEKK